MTSIIILTLNNWPLTRRCLASIRQFTSPPYEVIVIDNGSTDGTVRHLQQFPGIRVIANTQNVGFAAGTNQGMGAARGEQLLLLNNDTIVSANWLNNLLQALHSQPQVGMVGPLSNMTLPKQYLRASYPDEEAYQRFAASYNRHNPAKWKPAKALSGFCLLLKREVYARIGPMDERFAYGNFEDIDYCYRAQRAGFTLLIAGDTYVHHDGNESFRKNRIDLVAVARQNRKRFIEKWGFAPEMLVNG